MPPRKDFILFLDLETTGVDAELDSIIEVGLSMVSTEEGYPEVGSFSRVVLPRISSYNRMLSVDVVREMHEKNGLLQEVKELVHPDDGVMFPAHYPWMVDKDIVNWMGEFVGNDKTHIPLGGSGVLHFDRRFIKAYLPLLDGRLTHWAYDVGVLRRTFMKAGVKYASMDSKTHRALDDARVHAEEWRYYQRVIGGLERG